MRSYLRLILLMALAASLSSCSTKTTIMDKLQADGNFKTLVTALETTGLAEKLKAEGPFTLFAPTDDAFAAAKEGLQYRGQRITSRGPQRVHPLPKDRESLRQALENHIVSGNLSAADLEKRREDETINNMTISFDIKGNINELRSRPSNAVRRPDDMFMVNLGPHGKFSMKEYTSNLISTDIKASNGVIHVIDAVLLHPIADAAPK